jgi:hypothetical protein
MTRALADGMRGLQTVRVEKSVFYLTTKDMMEMWIVLGRLSYGERSSHFWSHCRDRKACIYATFNNMPF